MPPRNRPATALRALAAANARYWSTVAPAVHRELSAWGAPASAVPDPSLRALALHKLRDERFNAEVAATLATLAPRPNRGAATRGIVALELLFDYLDGRTETLPDPLSESTRLFAPFVDALRDPSALGPASFESIPPQEFDARPGSDADDDAPDWPYLQALSSRTRDGFNSLPAADAVRPFALAAARRCSEAQTRIHAVPTVGASQLQSWASEPAAAASLEWREYVSGSASSVLAVHALISAAADPTCTEADARKIDAAYLAIAAVITILDSVVDQVEDTARGQLGFIALFDDPRELEARLRSLIREAISRAWEAPHGAHHAMTLAGVAAYYTTHPGVSSQAAQPIAQMVRRELAPTIYPTLGVMRSWRFAKLMRARSRNQPIRRPADVQ